MILVKSCVAERISHQISSRDIYENYICFTLFTFVYCQNGLLFFSLFYDFLKYILFPPESKHDVRSSLEIN